LIASRSRNAAIGAAFSLIVIAASALAQTATPKPTRTASVHGHVSDATGNSAIDVFVFLEHATENPGTDGALTHGVETQKVRTSGTGTFNIPSLDAGSYAIYAQTISGDRTPRSHFTLKARETKTVDLGFRPAQSSAQAPDFYDEPQFTVAGVTEASNSGGHGIENIKRASEALVKATGSLASDSANTQASSKPSNATADTAALETQRTVLRARIAAEEEAQNPTEQPRPKPHQPNSKKAAAPLSNSEQAELHEQLARLDEALGDPLEAVNEYQRAEELAPSEAHCFDWATELLTHRAFEPATEIFEQGHRHYPQSMHMLLGLGVTWYARGDDDQAARYFRAASDLAPDDTTPYMFLGRMETAENMPTEETVAYFARFARLAPDNAWANYYYAVGVWKRALSEGPIDDPTFKQVETLLQRALQLDPKFAEAHLLLGTLYGARENYAQAIAEFQDAIAINPDLEEPHYRLALAYRRTGNDAEAQKEMQIHDRLQAKAKEDAERRRKSIQQFVISLRD
jgi:tetratricopeptide (TPR) repeat protein